MHYLSASLSIILLVIVVNEGVGQVVTVHQDWDQIAQESRPLRTATIYSHGSTYVNQANISSPTPITQQSSKPDLTRPPSKPPIPSGPNIQGKQLKYVEMTPPRPVYYTQQGNIPPGAYNIQKPNHMKAPHGPYKYPKVIPLNGHNRHQYHNNQGAAPGRQPTLVYAASSGKPVYIKGNSPKFSIPVQTVNGIRSSEVRPPRIHNTTTSTTTTTTAKPLRNKRIWPKHILDKMKTYNDTSRLNSTITVTNTTRLTTNITDYETSASIQIRRYVPRFNSTTTTSTEATSRAYKRVTRRPTHRSSTASPINATSDFKPNDWVPIVPQHFTNIKRYVPKTIRRSDSGLTDFQTPAQDRRMLYLHSIGLVPVQRMPSSTKGQKKMMVFFRKQKRQLNPDISSSYRRRPMYRPHRVVYGDQHAQGSHPRVVTKIKHHHHHHHHKYIKTVEKPIKVPFKVEVPKPYPYPIERRVPFPVEKVKIVEKKVPYAVPFEKRVPYPVQVKVPQPFPVKVVEKEYVPKPYPVVQQVPVIRHVHVKVPHPVPVQVEKQVPYPVHVKVPVPVDRPVPFAVPYEKKVHVPVPVRILVPQPYPVETKVPYPVEVKVKEPVEVIKHIRVPVKVPHPVPIKVPITVEKRVPYPVEVEKKVPVPFRVYVPHRVEVEKKVPVYIPKPYPVEKKVAVPFKVAVKVPVKVPVEVPVPIYLGHLSQSDYNDYQSVIPASTATPADVSSISTGFSVNSSPVTQNPHYTVTVHGNGAFTGFSDRSDTPTTTSATTTQ